MKVMNIEEIENLKEVTERGMISFGKIIDYLGVDNFIDNYLYDETNESEEDDTIWR